MSQTMKSSITEQVLNISSGAVISYLVYILVIIPCITAGWFAITDAVVIVGIFTVTSFIRSLVWRRLFNFYSKRSEQHVRVF